MFIVHPGGRVEIPCHSQVFHSLSHYRHRLLLVLNSQIQISESSDSEQHNESDREAKRVTRRPRKPGKKKHPKKKWQIPWLISRS